MAITKPARDIFAVLVAYAGVEDTKANREDFGRFYENRELYDPRFIRPSGFPGRIRYCKAGDGWSLEDRPMTKEERDGGGAGRGGCVAIFSSESRRPWPRSTLAAHGDG